MHWRVHEILKRTLIFLLEMEVILVFLAKEMVQSGDFVFWRTSYLCGWYLQKKINRFWIELFFYEGTKGKYNILFVRFVILTKLILHTIRSLWLLTCYDL